jgi:hypothetical protein
VGLKKLGTIEKEKSTPTRYLNTDKLFWCFYDFYIITTDFGFIT